MDKVIKAIKCAKCQKTLESPVLLPCNHSICKKHVTEKNIKDTLKCPKCGVDHKVPSSGFLLNEALSELISAKIDSIDLGRVHKEAKDSCDELNRFINIIDRLLKNPSRFTYDEINRLRNRVHIRSEEIKLKIDEETDKLILKLDEYENRCRVSVTTDAYFNERSKFELCKDKGLTDLAWFKKELDEIKFDEVKWDVINRMSSEKVRELEATVKALKEELLLKEFNRYSSEVDRFERLDIDSLFGQLNRDKCVDGVNKIKSSIVQSIAPNNDSNSVETASNQLLNIGVTSTVQASASLVSWRPNFSLILTKASLLSLNDNSTKS